MNRDGFTLVEVMVAITVSTLLALAAHHGVATLRDLAERAEGRQEEAARAAAVRRQLVEWLRAAHLDTSQLRSFHGLDRATAEGAPDDVLSFPTLATGASPAGAGAGEPTLVVLRIERDPSARDAGLIAELTSGSASNAAQADPVAVQRGGTLRTTTLALVPGATGLDARYLFTAGEEWRWLPGWSSVVRLPDAVEIRILGDPVPPLLRLPITVPLVTGG